MCSQIQNCSYIHFIYICVYCVLCIVHIIYNVCIYIYMYVYVCVYIYVCMYIYIYCIYIIYVNVSCLSMSLLEIPRIAKTAVDEQGWKRRMNQPANILWLHMMLWHGRQMTRVLNQVKQQGHGGVKSGVQQQVYQKCRFKQQNRGLSDSIDQHGGWLRKKSACMALAGLFHLWSQWGSETMQQLPRILSALKH